ncbi:hypothetical protein BG011_004530 [Mortierella polycephala]|uniref:Uncharacterized protein n=1 Tax=Mortierella polycephala TaxID=41804 RepID=A0A9P6QJE6_9FUNG|nr:hypothetical protein BG011_004530 [Mortierella polycephala]
MTVTAQEKLLATCPCLNVKLHLANEQEQGVSLAGKELKLGLAGVSVEQKILCNLSISTDSATVKCINCNHDVYTFQTSSNSVKIDSTSLAFLPSSVTFSPSDGIVVPSDAVVTGQDITRLVNDPNYSKAFRLVLTPSTASSSTPNHGNSAAASFPTDHTFSGTTMPSTTTQSYQDRVYRPHLERVRTILDKELEMNVNAQQQRTEAKIEAYKSQQLLALQKSIENTKREKEQLWDRIQERVTPPPPSFSLNLDASNNSSLEDGPGVNSHLHPFDVPSTLPIRLTSASRVDGPHGAFLDRRRGSVSEVAMSLQFRDFDQRMASNSLRRQSLVQAPVMTTENTIDQTLANTVANAALDRSPMGTSHASQNSDLSVNSTESRTQKSKKKVTIAEAIKSVSIVEPEEEDVEEVEGDDTEEEEGVVFDLDEELGFDEEGSVNEEDDEDNDNESQENDDDEDWNRTATNGNGMAINIASSSRSLPRQSGMIAGSLRANYLRRQRGLEQHRRSFKDDDMDFDYSDDDEDDTNTRDNPGVPPAAYFGTSLPIRIQARPANPLPPPPTARPSAIASSLALPPGSSPAAAMLQRRLSRAYGTEGLAEIHGAINNIGKTGSQSGVDNPSLLSLPGATLGTLIIDPLMLLEDEHDNDDREDQLRKHRQPFSAINHRRDLERSQQQQLSSTGPSFSSATQLSGFEPPHLYSARTYVGSTPWEMPTRITVKSGGVQREGTHLDKQIAMEMAKELENERQELLAATSTSYRTVEKIDEAEEEDDHEDTASRKQQQQPPLDG